MKELKEQFKLVQQLVELCDTITHMKTYDVTGFEAIFTIMEREFMKLNMMDTEYQERINHD